VSQQPSADADLTVEVLVASALGAQTRATGAGMLLAPTVNLHRTPLGGRNFACFSEDPELTARMTTAHVTGVYVTGVYVTGVYVTGAYVTGAYVTGAYVTGAQSQGVACCVKHLVGNDQESGRHTASSAVDEAPADGEVSEEAVDTSARRVIRLLECTSSTNWPAKSITQTTRSSEGDHAIDLIRIEVR
jgi:beta-glucosidase-like glycosyl hydrolase